VNQWPEEDPRIRDPRIREPRRPTPGAYGSVSPAQDQARRLAERMRESLAAVGFDVDRDFPTLHGDVTVAHEPFLTLGRLSADVGERLVAALAGPVVGTGAGPVVGGGGGRRRLRGAV
jgi:hypothetical protein